MRFGDQHPKKSETPALSPSPIRRLQPRNRSRSKSSENGVCGRAGFRLPSVRTATTASGNLRPPKSAMTLKLPILHGDSPLTCNVLQPKSLKRRNYAQSTNGQPTCGKVARLLFGLDGRVCSTSSRASKTSEDCHRKDAGDIPTTNAARGPHDTCGRTKERDRFSSRVKTLPENPRRIAATTGIPTRTLPASPDGKHPHRTGTSQRPSAADFPATRPKIRQSTIETVPRRTIPWTPPVISPAA